MPEHAHFAAVMGMSERVIQDIVRIAYLSGDFPHAFQVAETVAFLRFEADFFSDAPRFTLSAAREESFQVDLAAWGPMTVALPQWQNGAFVTVPETRKVRFIGELRVPHNVTIDGAELTLGVVADEAVLVSYSFEILSGGAFSDGVTTFLDSTIFRDKLQDAIRTELAAMTSELPTIDVSFLDLLLGVSGDEDDDIPVERFATARARDGVLVIGIDIRLWLFGTAGNPNLLKDDSRGLDLWAVGNPDLWVPNMEKELEEGEEDDGEGIRAQVEEQGATLDSFNLEMREGHLHVSGSASRDEGSVDFSLDIVPKLNRPPVYRDLGPDEYGRPTIITVPGREELWFDKANINVTVNQARWITLIEVIGGILTLGIFALVVRAFITMVRNNVVAGMTGDDGGENRTQTFRFTEGGPAVTVKIDAFEFHVDSIYMGMTFTPDYPEPRIYSTSHGHARASSSHVIDVNERLRRASLVYRVQLPYQLHPDDPDLRIRWIVRNVDTNIILVETNQPAADAEELIITDFANASQLRLSCRVYRTLGSNIEDFFNGTFDVRFRDRLDRKHPYVRWRHYVWTPDVRVEEDGSHTILGGFVKYRTSRIHRTDFPGRCSMVSKYSIRTPPKYRPPHSVPPKIEYLDSLPWIDAELHRHRRYLCDYCFFGAPTGTQVVPRPNP